MWYWHRNAQTVQWNIVKHMQEHDLWHINVGKVIWKLCWNKWLQKIDKLYTLNKPIPYEWSYMWKTLKKKNLKNLE